jgi:hypothetical protein
MVPRRPHHRRTPKVAAVGLLALVLAGCVHPPSPPAAARELHALDARFVAFTATRLNDLDDAEDAIARLEAIRLDWLAVIGRVTGPDAEHDRSIALVRLAELHLDLAARIRRIPYATGSDAGGRAAFDAALSRLALPLEATGHGVLAQVVDRAERQRLDGRFVRRARLYLRLHNGIALAHDDVVVLQEELAATTFRAPSTLLQAGRVGQRASR